MSTQNEKFFSKSKIILISSLFFTYLFFNFFGANAGFIYSIIETMFPLVEMQLIIQSEFKLIKNKIDFLIFNVSLFLLNLGLSISKYFHDSNVSMDYLEKFPLLYSLVSSEYLYNTLDFIMQWNTFLTIMTCLFATSIIKMYNDFKQEDWTNGSIIISSAGFFKERFNYVLNDMKEIIISAVGSAKQRISSDDSYVVGNLI